MERIFPHILKPERGMVRRRRNRRQRQETDEEEEAKCPSKEEVNKEI